MPTCDGNRCCCSLTEQRQASGLVPQLQHTNASVEELVYQVVECLFRRASCQQDTEPDILQPLPTGHRRQCCPLEGVEPVPESFKRNRIIRCNETAALFEAAKRLAASGGIGGNQIRQRGPWWCPRYGHASTNITRHISQANSLAVRSARQNHRQVVPNGLGLPGEVDVIQDESQGILKHTNRLGCPICRGIEHSPSPHTRL